MVLEFFHWFIIGFLLLLPILYELSATFRYYAKFTLYYAFIMGTASVVCVYGLFRPGDVNNHWFIIWSMKHVRRLFGIEIEVRNRENLESDKPYILVMNHQSSLDCLDLWMMHTCLGEWLIYFGAASLNQEKALQTMKKTAKTIVERNVKLLVFPEGTRNHEGGMMPFKKGCFHLAVQAQIPIVPVVFSSYSEFYNKQDKKFTSGKFIATCMPKISTKGLTSDDVAELTENVRKQMLEVYNQTSLESTQIKLASKVVNGSK